jgi:hypothetical protein
MQMDRCTATAVAVLEDGFIVLQEELTYANGLGLKDTNAGLEPAMYNVKFRLESSSAWAFERAKLEIEEWSGSFGNY